MSHEIYALLDDSGAIRYIGKTKTGLRTRVSNHWSARYAMVSWDSPVYQWLRALDTPPAARTLVIVEDSEVERLPRPWNIELAAIRAASDHWPGQLLNVQDGRYFPVNDPDLPHRHAARLHSRSDPSITISQGGELPGAGSRKPRLLDLFCGAGGASVGYHLAGFEVVGLDLEPQPNYPFTFIQADAMTFPLDDFDAYHASPICYRWSKMRDCRPGSRDEQPDLITPMRPRLQATGCPYVIENVPGAPLINPVRICGSGLGMTLQRHRDFECSFPAWSIPCSHGSNPWNPAYGHATGRKRRRVPVIGEWRIPEPLQQQAMGIDWMTLAELQEAIPPAYTEYIGGALLEHLAERAA